MAKAFTSAPIPIPAATRSGEFARADIVLEGIEQAGPSFEAHLFLNNATADSETERTPAAGYAGAFHVYGHGPSAAGAAPTGVQAPITKHVIATDAVRAAVRDADEITVTVVPVAMGAGRLAPLAPDRVSIVFDPGG